MKQRSPKSKRRKYEVASQQKRTGASKKTSKPRQSSFLKKIAQRTHPGEWITQSHSSSEAFAQQTHTLERITKRSPSLERVTQRLIIRPLELSDFEVWRSGLASFHSPKNSWDEGGVTPALLNKREFNKLLRTQRQNRARDFQYDFAVFDRESGSFIGSTALMDISRAVFQNAYIGYWIGNTCWGNSLGKEAVDATINIAFNDLKLHRVEAGIAPGNRRSIRLARSLGMRREGRSLRRLFLRGQWQDMLIYALTAEER